MSILPGCQCVFDDLTWENGYGSYAGGNQSYGIGSLNGGGGSGNENGSSAYENSDGSETCGVGRDKYNLSS